MKNTFLLGLLVLIAVVSQANDNARNNMVSELLKPSNEYVQDTTKKGAVALLAKAPKGSKVFIRAEDKGVLTHAAKNIDYWHYWQIVEDVEEADFVLEIKFRYGNLGHSFSYAIFTDVNNNLIFRTKEVDNFGNFDLNFKRSSVNNLLDNVVKPFFEL